MGQYYLIVNLDKKEMLDPSTFGEGAKLLQFTHGSRTMAALALLLLDNDGGRGLAFCGRWRGDRVAIVGDELPFNNAYDIAEAEYENISGPLIEACAADGWIAKVTEPAPEP